MRLTYKQFADVKTDAEKQDFKEIWKNRTGYLTFDKQGNYVLTSTEKDNYTPVKVSKCGKESILLRIL
jgi:hypothetical protein